MCLSPGQTISLHVSSVSIAFQTTTATPSSSSRPATCCRRSQERSISFSSWNRHCRCHWSVFVTCQVGLRLSCLHGCLCSVLSVTNDLVNALRPFPLAPQNGLVLRPPCPQPLHKTVRYSRTCLARPKPLLISERPTPTKILPLPWGWPLLTASTIRPILYILRISADGVLCPDSMFQLVVASLDEFTLMVFNPFSALVCFRPILRPMLSDWL